MKYDYLIVGAGLFGATFAEQARKNKQSCIVIDRRNHIGGNCYTEKTEYNIDIHKYGPHIFHTNNEKIWDYVNQFAKFNNFVNRPKVSFKNEIYSFPINLFTLYQIWGIKNPNECRQKINQVKLDIKNPKNLEEWVLSQVGSEIYQTFIYGYTKKQWNTEPKNLPASIIKRLPIRFTFDDNYFNDSYQGIPVNGYTEMIKNMFDKTEIICDTDYFENKDYYDSLAHRVIYTGHIDRFFDYKFDRLRYRSLRFQQSLLNTNDFQGNAVINFTDSSVPYTRIVEHKHFNLNPKNIDCGHTYITKEYPEDFNESNNEPYYPINDDFNNQIYLKYKNLINPLNKKYIFGGRLAEYRYMDMHQVIASAINIYSKYNELK